MAAITQGKPTKNIQVWEEDWAYIRETTPRTQSYAERVHGWIEAEKARKEDST